MNNRDWHNVAVRTFDNSIDEYGQQRQGLYSDRIVEMMVSLYSLKYVTDVRYNDVEMLFLTNDKTITDKNELVYDGNNYIILHAIPSDRLLQLLCKKK